MAELLLREDLGVEKMSSHIVVVEAKRFAGYPITTTAAKSVR